MDKRNLVAGLVLIAVGIGYGLLTARLPTRAFENTTEPSFFPWVITVCLLALSAALVVQGWRATTADGAPPPLGATAVKLATALVVAVAFLALLPSLGFLVAGVPLFAALMALYGERRPAWLIGGAVGVPVALFFLFRQVFQILLPAGVADGWLT